MNTKGLLAQGISRGGNGFGDPVPVNTEQANQAINQGQLVPAVNAGGQNPPPAQNPNDFGTPDGLDVFKLGQGQGNLEIFELIQLVIVYAFIAAAALSAIFIFVGGINFILSGGNDEKIKRAVNTIRYSIIGLIITILSFTFVTIIGRIFGLNFLDYISYDSIRTSLDRIIQGNQNGGSPDIFSPN